MEILYIYFKDHYLFAGQGFNFGGKFLFEYDEKSEELAAFENPYYIKGFYDKHVGKSDVAHILNVTGIIAENGAGKTTLVNFIRDNFPRGKDEIDKPIMIVYEENEKIFVEHDEKIVIKNDNYNEYRFKKRKFEQNILLNHSSVKGEIFENTDFIYFSNIFDGQLTSSVVNGLFDISTNFLIREDHINDILNMEISPNNHYNEVDTFLVNDVKRQIDYIYTYISSSKLPIKIPQFLNISVKREYSDFSDAFGASEIRILELPNLRELTRYLIDSAKEITNYTKDLETRAQIHFITAMVVNYLFEFSDLLGKSGREVHMDYKKLEFAKVENDFQNFITVFLDNFEKKINYDNARFGEYIIVRLNGIRNFLNHLNKIIKTKNVIPRDNISFWIDTQNNQKCVKEFFNLYLQSYSLKPYLNFNWQGMSSGEIALLNLYSRFYSILEIQRKFNSSQLAKNLIILIDEGDTYLHPTWQKGFINGLLEHLPIIFAPENGQEKNIQIVFTTNSPIPASDLPNTSIIFLEKSDGHTIVKKSLEDKKLTFAANINTLLSDSFFMSGGTLGDFAKTKINDLIEILQIPRKLNKEEEKALEKGISMIGEPIVKNKLLQMLNDKLNVNLISMSKRLEDLENEVKKLKGKKS